MMKVKDMRTSNRHVDEAVSVIICAITQHTQTQVLHERMQMELMHSRKHNLGLSGFMECIEVLYIHYSVRTV